MIRTRFSPSPTGLIHLGNARAALFSALFAKQKNGAFILRIEDTDLARSAQSYVEMLQDDLHWLEINWQEGPEVNGPHQPYFQSERGKIYEKYYDELEKTARAYPCFCTDQELALNRKVQLSRGIAPRYPGTCRNLSKDEINKKLAEGLKPALRFRVPDRTKIEFTDLVKGIQKFSSDDIGDFIIRRAEGSPSFLFCNAIDDSLMEITHVLRGDDHLTNTPRQLMILNTLKMRAPEYGHLSLILGDDGSPLSKRHGSFSLHDLHKQGFLARAVYNYLARLSHTYTERGLLTFNELAEHFTLERLSRAPARFDKNQLLHWQKEAVMALSPDEMWEWLGEYYKYQVPASSHQLFINIMRQNILFPNEAEKWVIILFGEDLNYTDEQKHILNEAGKSFFNEATLALEKYGSDLNSILNELKEKLKISGKKLFMPMRIALTGEQHGPELMQIALLLGSEKMHKRFQNALDQIRK